MPARVAQPGSHPTSQGKEHIVFLGRQPPVAVARSRDPPGGPCRLARFALSFISDQILVDVVKDTLSCSSLFGFDVTLSIFDRSVSTLLMEKHLLAGVEILRSFSTGGPCCMVFRLRLQEASVKDSETRAR